MFSDAMNEFFDDMEMMGYQYKETAPSDWAASNGYYSVIDYSKYDEKFDDTLDFIAALPQKGDESC